MDVDHGAKRDETHQRLVRKEVQALLKRVLQVIQLLVVDTGVDHKHEHGGTSVLGRQLVLQSRELGNQLSWQLRLADVCSVVRWEVVAVQTKWACPHFGSEVHLAIRVQDASTPCTFAADRFVLHSWGHAINGLEGGVPAVTETKASQVSAGMCRRHPVPHLHAAYGHHCARCSKACGWPHAPCETDSITLL